MPAVGIVVAYHGLGASFWTVNSGLTASVPSTGKTSVETLGSMMQSFLLQLFFDRRIAPKMWFWVSMQKAGLTM
jgi:hypothetical protein